VTKKLPGRSALAAVYVAMLLSFSNGTHSAKSICSGTPSKGGLQHGVALPATGPNFQSYSALGNQLGRTYVHSLVQRIVVQAYHQLEGTSPDTKFVYGETGFASGGPFKPHRTHQNGLSVDFMVPVLSAQGQSVPLSTHVGNKWGYDIEFDDAAKLDGLRIDFEAMAEHLYQLEVAARQSGTGIALVIFEPKFHAALFATRRGPELQKRLKFMTKHAWVRHDEHYHVDFDVACVK
jgi:penicillin-insensitive murein DD-endopeptidase